MQRSSTPQCKVSRPGHQREWEGPLAGQLLRLKQREVSLSSAPPRLPIAEGSVRPTLSIEGDAAPTARQTLRMGPAAAAILKEGLTAPGVPDAFTCQTFPAACGRRNLGQSGGIQSRGLGRSANLRWRLVV